jgi:hypothetical protein
MIQGPNVRKLIAHKMSLLMVPKGAGLAGALKSMVTPGAIGNFAREATQWVETALAAMTMRRSPWRSLGGYPP